MRTLAGLLLVAVCVRLGIWQLDRNDQRAARNAVIEANANAEPVPLDDVASPDEPLGSGDEWQQVRVSGTYDPDHELIVQLRPLAGEAGVHVVTPLVTDAGDALLVDRGFVAGGGPADSSTDIPEASTGPVDVVARLRRSEEGRGTGGDPADGAVRYLDVDAIAAIMPYPLYGAWAELVEQSPPADDPPVAVPAPEIDAGPHLSYAIQWFLFACVGVGGFVLLVRAEARGRRELDAGHPEGPEPTEPVEPTQPRAGSDSTR